MHAWHGEAIPVYPMHDARHVCDLQRTEQRAPLGKIAIVAQCRWPSGGSWQHCSKPPHSAGGQAGTTDQNLRDLQGRQKHFK